MCEPRETTSVLYVRRQDAKAVKTRLESASLLDKRFRMAPLVNDGSKTADGDTDTDPDSDAAIAMTNMKNCIAVPVTAECTERLQQYHDRSKAADSSSASTCNDDDIMLSKLIVGFGRQTCPFSTSMLGNNNINNRHRTTAGPKTPLTNVQYALIETLTTWLDNNDNKISNDENNKATRIETLVRSLSIQTCPKKLEVIGDDRTLVVPRWSLFVCNTVCEKATAEMKSLVDGPKKSSSEFRELLVSVVHDGHKQENGNEPNNNDAPNHPTPQTNYNDDYSTVIYEIQSQLWTNLALIHNSPRVVRRGDIDPESGVRESGHRILFPMLPLTANDDDSAINGDCNRGYLPTQTGTNSPGWITVTEHKIHQSFDFTRVMFSRGNVTEKKRFGMSCVQPGENVLDMYAGIGYYTLPALIHGRAGHVTACEWNGHALTALRYNLKANGVENKATVLEGDCRLQLKRLLEQSNNNGDSDENGGVNSTTKNNQFDRISLGLLPSSEGGWAIAVSCLRRSTGGWLHVHANVPTAERQDWTHWLCRSLARIAAEQLNSETKSKDWIAVCTHVERVKSFAPKVDHIVADVFLGPCDSPTVPSLEEGRRTCSETGAVDSLGKFAPSPYDGSPPSCALNEKGILHQNWMREN
mmetsp:Transcript_24876/g.53663  ORF Transcript_24876/g.53663 Transcript_24876/m.53663 type:complete len:640 (+) Transcript_24876:194-2113(+)